MASDNADIRRLVNEALADLSLDEIRTLTQQLLNTAPPIQDLIAATKPASRRRPRRKKPVTLRVRVDLSDTKPKVWRRLELASDLMLDEVHRIIQTAFGWTDSHLHQFGSGPSYYSPQTEYYLCPFMVDEGERGVPEDQVRLDELLVDVGDKLFYLYDFGDSWRHVIRLEAVLARDESAPRAVCTGGRGPAPAEDCGGVGGYALLVAATDPHHRDHAAARAEYAEIFGADVDPRCWAPTPFDLDQINRELAGGGGTAVDVDTADAAIRPYLWLLHRVGDDGIKLTQAGYLPPVDVYAAFTELGFDAHWIGAGNREDLTYPVWELRQSAQRIGLLRKYRGRLLATARGRALRDDAVGLRRYIAEQAPGAVG
ncbi:plasmid pRiA4b ORF-3 family protein [Mycobacterium sp. M1]|uniref:Plasmid pRiA4b ORF-3 family protein n=1 Tax=Mycolicibacter acidiphilus TaxID=2835306 RepID=A0ABS5RMD4_9MYCO|nr:plasmid pRiA4b ORF-3 family protein [Mycolicibacter acidiphilus]MBS9535471.1 plasmid pRiA4b ORF-3 family protein [Mycolicibacter acidiphilus]